jgi:hypothetical protein
MIQRQSEVQAKQRNAELVELALDIIGRGSALKSKVEQAVDYVQRMKTTRKSAWSYNLRYGVITVQQRYAAEKIAASLRSLKGALKPLETDRRLRRHLQIETESGEFMDFPLDRGAIERWEKHAQKVADTKVREGSKFDARKLLAAQQAAGLLDAAGLRLNQTRNGKFDQLAAILYGEPAADFRHYLGQYMRLRARSASSAS